MHLAFEKRALTILSNFENLIGYLVDNHRWVKPVARGIVIIGWDNKIGTILEAKYPPYIRMETNHATMIYSMHTMSSRNPGFVAIKKGGLSVASYYAGLETNKCLVVLLEQNEIPSVYQEDLPKIMNEYFNINSNINYDKVLPKIYKKIVKIGKGGKAVKKIMGWF